MFNKNVDLPQEIIDTIKKYIISLSQKYKIYSISQDAFNEGVLAYYNALSTFNPHINKDINQWINLNIWNSLNNFYKKEKNIIVSSKELDVHQELTNYNMDYDLCDVMLEVINELTYFEQKIYFLHLDGYSYLAIAKEVGYPKTKIINIINNISGYMKHKVKEVGYDI